MSSPRSWGCFLLWVDSDKWFDVFPTLVGVFLWFLSRIRWRAGLPHARGGVSKVSEESVIIIRSSPRSWGCFLEAEVFHHVKHVFPTLVGVFLPLPASYVTSIGLPHARGGVSDSECKKENFWRSSPRSWGCFLINDAGDWVD